MENIPQNCILEEGFVYEIVKKIPTNSLNRIFLVKFEDEECIAKVIKLEHKDNFLNEATILQLFINEDKIIQYKKSGTGLLKFQDKDGVISENVNYIIFEYAPKGDLADYLIQQSGLNILENGVLNEEFSKYIFYKILEGIEKCHQKNICHRDIKLDNIFWETFTN